MKKHKIVVERGDTCIPVLFVLTRQDDGYYEYIPKKGDSVSLYIKNSNGTSVSLVRREIGFDNTERITLNIPTNLEKGEYTYDVVLETSEGEIHTICDDNILIIKDDGAHAQLV